MNVAVLTREPLYGIKMTRDLIGMGPTTQWMNFNTGTFEITEYPSSDHITRSLALVHGLYEQSNHPNETIETFYLTQVVPT